MATAFTQIKGDADPPRRDVPRCNSEPASDLTRQVLAEDFRAVRASTEALVVNLSAEDQNLQSMPGASPVKWHRAHTTWFFDAFVLDPFNGRREAGPAWNYLFNSYYNGIGRQYPRPQRGLISRPDVDEVTRYRETVDAAVLDLIERSPESRWPELSTLLRLGLNHEQQHQELLVTDLKHAFSYNPIQPAWADRPEMSEADAKPVRWLTFDECIARFGADDDGRFCFDNEHPRHRQVVHGFELAHRPVTCGEYLEFMEDGGYGDASLWLSDGWAWLQETGVEAPLYWQRSDDGGWSVYTPGGPRELDANETLAHVSCYEALAFAQWAGARLPTEFEWELAATRGSDQSGSFAEHGRFHPAAALPTAGPDETASLFGNVWEWTSSPYGPYPGFRPPSGAVGEYNGKFMANQMVLRGGSCATPRGHVRATYRNFFYPPDRWQFSGIRLARTR